MTTTPDRPGASDPQGSSERQGSTSDPRGNAAPPSLLQDLLTDHLDPGYAAAARRRAVRDQAGRAAPRGQRPASVLTILLLVAAGILIAVAYHQTQRSAPVVRKTNTELVGQIGHRTQGLDTSQAQDNSLRAQVDRLRAQALADSRQGRTLSTRLRRLQLATSTQAVRGPGLVVTVGDGDTGADPAASPGTGSTDPSLVQDRDLQSVVNALWAAGAEAISINGQRLSALSTIRAAGQAILVDFRPVLSPYSIRAIGAPDQLAAGFAASQTAADFRTFQQLYGMTFTTEQAASLLVPAASTPTLRYAHSPSATPIPGPTSASPSTGPS